MFLTYAVLFASNKPHTTWSYHQTLDNALVAGEEISNNYTAKSIDIYEMENEWTTKKLVAAVRTLK